MRGAARRYRYGISPASPSNLSAWAKNSTVLKSSIRKGWRTGFWARATCWRSLNRRNAASTTRRRNSGFAKSKKGALLIWMIFGAVDADEKNGRHGRAAGEITRAIPTGERAVQSGSGLKTGASDERHHPLDDLGGTHSTRTDQSEPQTAHCRRRRRARPGSQPAARTV